MNVCGLVALMFGIVAAPVAAQLALGETTLGRRLIATELGAALVSALAATGVVVCWWLAVRQW